MEHLPLNELLKKDFFSYVQNEIDLIARHPSCSQAAFDAIVLLLGHLKKTDLIASGQAAVFLEEAQKALSIAKTSPWFKFVGS
jgi:hypothetical protein